MKFSCSIEINKSLDLVVKSFRADEHYPACFKDYISKQLISGEPQQNGTKTALMYQFGKNQMKLTETILENNLPHHFLAEYDCQPMCNTMESQFEALSQNQTKLIIDVHYTRFTGFMPNMLKLFGARMFKKQSQNFLDLFKEFVENQASS